MHERASIRRAEVLSTVGAAFLGAGLALLAQRWVGGYGVPLLLGGVAAHGIGMAMRHRLETHAGVDRAKWEDAIYWGCWARLAGLVAWPLLRS